MTKLGIILQICLGLLAAASARATSLHPHLEALKAAGNRRISVSRYSAHPDFHSQRVLQWSLEDGRFVQGRKASARVLIGARDCESLLSEQQHFALDKMASTEYISAEDIQMYLKMSAGFDPAQVNVALASRDLPEAEARRMFGDKTEKRINHALRDYDGGMVPIVTASMWSVGGQVLNLRTGMVDRRPLPWEKDKDRRELARTFDRKKYPLVFEWGRTAQDLPKEAEPLGSVLAGLNYQEVLGLGGRLEDAYVMFHSFDEVNTRAYSMRFPDSLYPKDWKNKNDALFLVPLSKVLAAFPPSRHSAHFAAVIAASEGRLNETSALDFLWRFDRIRFTQVDVKHKSGVFFPRPLAIHDLSKGAAFRRLQLLDEMKLNHESDELMKVLMARESVLPSWNSGQYPDLADMQYSQHFYREQNAVEISNLDPDVAAHDPLYIERSLIGVFMFYLKALSKDVYDPVTLRRWVETLRANDVKFGITSFDPKLIARVSKLNPVAREKFEYPLEPGMLKPEFPGMEWMARGYENEPQAMIFSVDQILALIQAHPKVYEEALNSVLENNWTRQLYLSNPDVF